MIIDTENLDTLTLPEMAMLLLLYDKRTDNSKTVLEVKDVDILKLLDKLQDKGYITSTIYATDFDYQPPYSRTCWSLLQKGKQAIADNLVKDKKITKIVSNKALVARCDALAQKLMLIYPEGTKPGTSLKWRGNIDVVSDKLQKHIKAGHDFTDEEAIEATKEYVGNFNGMYTTMRVLPYFISKNLLKGGEVEKTRDFLSYIEDLRTSSRRAVSKNWENELK